MSCWDIWAASWLTAAWNSDKYVFVNSAWQCLRLQDGVRWYNAKCGERREMGFRESAESLFGDTRGGRDKEKGLAMCFTSAKSRRTEDNVVTWRPDGDGGALLHPSLWEVKWWSAENWISYRVLKLTLTSPENRLWAPLPNSVISNDKLITWIQPWCEYLHHGNWQMFLQAFGCFWFSFKNFGLDFLI